MSGARCVSLKLLASYTCWVQIVSYGCTSVLSATCVSPTLLHPSPWKVKTAIIPDFVLSYIYLFMLNEYFYHNDFTHINCRKYASFYCVVGQGHWLGTTDWHKCKMQKKRKKNRIRYCAVMTISARGRVCDDRLWFVFLSAWCLWREAAAF